MAGLSKKALKQILGKLPLTAEVYWRVLQQGRPLSESFSLQRTEKWLPIWRSQAETAARHATSGKKVLIFATLRYWIEHATLLGMALAGMGNEVFLAYLPYANWSKPVSRFDLRRQSAYAQKVLQNAVPLVQPISLLKVEAVKTDQIDQVRSDRLPGELEEAVMDVSLRDVQYTLQIEDVDLNGELYKLRTERNTQSAQAALTWMDAHHPDVVLTPNGSILEMGMVYQVARYLNIPVVTYEFGEQRERLWLAQNGEVMRQETEPLWEVRCNVPLSEEDREQVLTLFDSRQRADLWQNFSRRWQGQPSQGGEQARSALDLDEPSNNARPIVLLAANVIGDSLTLGRQVFTPDMTHWLQRTVEYFSTRPETQLVVRIHPGERYTQGSSVADIIRAVHPNLPDHIHIVAADDPVNTYDLVEIADLGLVYTTTVGLEMAMSGVPVIVAGQTHYRNKGFTIDPESWESYYQFLDQILQNPFDYRPTSTQIEQAWNYAYRFFFEYPFPFPWHLLHFWHELEDWSVERVLSEEGQVKYGDTFRYLLGEPINWSIPHYAFVQQI